MKLGIAIVVLELSWEKTYSRTKLCDGAQMANFCILYFQRASCSKFQTCILNLHWGHIMCGSMVDIQSATAESRREKKKKGNKERRNHSCKI